MKIRWVLRRLGSFCCCLHYFSANPCVTGLWRHCANYSFLNLLDVCEWADSKWYWFSTKLWTIGTFPQLFTNMAWAGFLYGVVWIFASLVMVFIEFWLDGMRCIDVADFQRGSLWYRQSMETVCVYVIYHWVVEIHVTLQSSRSMKRN